MKVVPILRPLLFAAALAACAAPDAGGPSPTGKEPIPDGGGGTGGSTKPPPPPSGGGSGGVGGGADASSPDTGTPGSKPTPPDAAGSDAGPIPGDGAAASCPPAGVLDDAWVTSYQMDVLGRLTGKVPYAPGKSLPNRGSVENRRIARELIAQMLTDLQLLPQMHDYSTGSNVFAVLPSTTGNTERVVLGGHYDTVPNSPGANDNATGVAAVLAAARAVAQLGCRSRTLLVVLFDQEEVGLIGSEHFATKLGADALPVHSIHSIDQLGWDEDQDHLIELERGDADIRKLYENAVAALKIDVPLSATRTGSTDHESFRPRWKAIGVTEEYAGGDTSPHRHRATDSYDTVDLTYLRTGTKVITRVMADLMSGP